MDRGQTGWVRRVLDAPTSRSAALAPEPPTAPPAPRAVRVEQGSTLEGTLALDRSLEIEGEYRGGINCREGVTVGETGTVEANIRARCVEIRGAVVGDIDASREVILRAGGRLHGKVSTPSFVVERGAFFNGETRMYRPELAAQARREAESAGDEPAAPDRPAVAAPVAE
jgi:cytoskeletal protein CcmA (bactofilin family)